MTFDIIGSKEKAVAIIDDKFKNPKSILKKHKNVKSVIQKKSGRSGVFRIYETKLVAGSKDTEVTHKEHGFLLKIDPRKVYFSPRESTERQRIAGMVKPNENILIMFSGAGPFSIAIAQKKPNTKITAVEINLDGVRYAEMNNKLNGITNVKNYCCDIRKIKKHGPFDRIIMPLPETAYQFLDSAYSMSKKGTIIHIYGISGEKSEFKDLEQRIKEFSRVHNIKYKIIGKQRVLPFGTRMWKVRLDLRIL